MNKMLQITRKLLMVTLAAGFVLTGFSACTTPTDEYGRTRPSTQAWSRPQGWEGTGALGVIQSQQERPNNRSNY